MERRIMSLGRSSMVISLPKNWMHLNELNKGDVVSFAIQRDRSLVVYPAPKRKTAPKEITLRISQDEDETINNSKNHRVIFKRVLWNHTYCRKNFFCSPAKSYSKHCWKTLHENNGVGLQRRLPPNFN